MKYKGMLLIVLIFSIFLTSCGNFNSIKKNQLVVEKLDKNTTSASDIASGKTILTEEEVKLKALEALEKYFNIKLYLTEVACDVQFDSPATIKKLLDVVSPSNYSQAELEYSKSTLGNGLYRVNFYPRLEKEKQAENVSFKFYSIGVDSKTGECLLFNGYSIDKGISSKRSIDIEEAKKIGEEFIVKNSISNIKNVKLVNEKRREEKEYTKYRLLFEDADASYKKVLICIDGNTKKISYFSTGIMEIIDFPVINSKN